MCSVDSYSSIGGRFGHCLDCGEAITVLSNSFIEIGVSVFARSFKLVEQVLSYDGCKSMAYLTCGISPMKLS